MIIRNIYIFVIIILLSTGLAEAQTFEYINNRIVKLGVRTDIGACVSYFSEYLPEKNLLNHFDTGRSVQQSYYGNAYDDIYFMEMLWRWNPVQGGDQYFNKSTVVEFSNDSSALYAKTIPKDWAQNNVDTECFMEEEIGLVGKIACIHFKMTYTGTEDQGTHSHEVPAAFFDIAFSTLVYYRGDFPWTDAPLTTEVPSYWQDVGNSSANNLRENWAAYVDGNGLGIGVYFRAWPPYPQDHINRITYYRFNGPSGPTGLGCSYFAAITSFSINTSSPTYEYDVFLCLGTVEEIRDEFKYIHNNGSPRLPADSTRPSAPSIINDGLDGNDLDITVSNNQLSASWEPATDDESGIVSYLYALGTSEGGTDIIDWTVTGSTGTSITVTGLELELDQVYYFSLAAKNGDGMISNTISSHGITVSRVFYNYPNPFSESTVFVFNLFSSHDIVIKIYSLSGRLIKRIFYSGIAGNNEVPWNGNNEKGRSLSNGVYFCRITADGQTLDMVNKLLIIR